MEGKAPLPRAATVSAAGHLTRSPPPPSDARRRGVPQTRIIELLIANGFAHLAAEGGLAEAHGLATDALDRWVSAGLPHEIDAGGGRRFDPIEVVNGFKWAGLHGRDGFWRDCSIPTGRRLTRDLARQDPDGRARMRVAFARRFELADLRADAEFLLRAPVPLDGPDHALAALAAETSEAAVIDDGRITVRLSPGLSGPARIAWTATLAPADAEAVEPVLSAEDAERYLRPMEGLIRVGSRIRELAGLWAGRRTGWDAAVAFRRRLGEALCMGTIGYEAFDVGGAMDWVLDHGWFDCRLGSALLVSLCRAHGLPARLVSGHHLYPLYPSNHSWAEAWDEGQGWKPIDLEGWDLSAGDADLEWRDVFVGRIERRIVTERPPRRVTGPMRLRFPGAWRLLHRLAEGGGLEVLFMDATSGRTVFTDRLQVSLEPAGLP